MKKLVSLVLALVMIMGLATTAFAADADVVLTTQNKAGSTDVKGKYVDAIETVNVVSVDIFWDAMEFTYTETGTSTWNPGTHRYDDVVEGAWTANDDKNTVEVVNHSNVDVKVSFAFTAETGYNVIGTFDKTEATTLAAGVVDGYDDAASVTATLTVVDGNLANTVTNFTKIGTITVTIDTIE